ncbi:MAG: LURP-one-related family protein [Actinomycetota bacterium]|nr:LURP-one-related family protein [Actinomycetota bacterium]
MREKMVSIGDDFWIENDQGERAFKVNGKALRVRDTLIFETPDGQELAKIQKRVARIKETMKVEGPDGSTLATIKKAMITPLRERHSVSIGDGEDLTVHGNIVDHEYTISADGGGKIAEVSKKWFRVRDTYGVEIEPGQNDVIILAVVGIDMM